MNNERTYSNVQINVESTFLIEVSQNVHTLQCFKNERIGTVIYFEKYEGISEMHDFVQH